MKLSRAQKRALMVLFHARPYPKAMVHKATLARLRRLGLTVDLGDYVGLTIEGKRIARQEYNKRSIESDNRGKTMA